MLLSSSIAPSPALKLLVYEQGGVTILFRRLEQGVFEVQAFDLDDRVLLFLQLHQTPLLRDLTNRGTEYKGKPG